MKLLLLVVLAGALSAEATEYIVHWTSTEKCYECNVAYAIACSTPGCNIPNKTVDHFELHLTRESALEGANIISGKGPKQTYLDWTNGTVGGVPPQSKTGTVVAIYEARKLPIKVETKEWETPQPAKKETSVVITFDK